MRFSPAEGSENGGICMDFPFFEPHGWGKRSADQPQPYYSKVPESASLWSSAFWQAIGIPQTEKQSISIIETLPGWKRNGINHQQGRGSVAPSFFRSRLPSHKQYARIGRNLTADNKILCYIKFFSRNCPNPISFASYTTERPFRNTRRNNHGR